MKAISINQAAEAFDSALACNPRNNVGSQVAEIIRKRTGLNGDFTTGMTGMSARRVANECHNGLNDWSTTHKAFTRHWKG